MRNTGEDCLSCHFHHVKLQAWHLVRLPAMPILSIKDEPGGSSSSSCLVILARKHSPRKQYHTLLSLLNIWWGIYRLRLGELGGVALYHAKKNIRLQREQSFQKFCDTKGAGCTFPLRGQRLSPACGKELSDPEQPFLCTSDSRTWYEQDKHVFRLVTLSAIDFLLTRLTVQLPGAALLVMDLLCLYARLHTAVVRHLKNQSCWNLGVHLLLRGCI